MRGRPRLTDCRRLKLLQSTITGERSELPTTGAIADRPRCRLASPATCPGYCVLNWRRQNTRTTTAPSALSAESHTPHSRVGNILFAVMGLGEGRQVADNPGRVLALTIPAAFFAAIDGTSNDGVEDVIGPSDALRSDFLGISRGFAVILLVMCARSLYFPTKRPKS